MATTFSEIEQADAAHVDDSALVKRTRRFRGINQNPQVSGKTIIDEFSAWSSIRRYTPYVGPDLAGDPTCLASALDAEQTDKMVEWLVTVYYSTMRMTSAPNLSPRQQRERAAMARDHQQSGQQPPQDPAERPPVLRIGSHEYEEVMLEDAIEEIEPGVKKPVWNAVRDRPVPPPTRPKTFRVVTLEKNERFFSSDFTHGFENTVNDAMWYSYAEGTVLCKAITADADFEGRWDFWRVTYLFHVNKDGWKYKMLNEGPNYYTAPLAEGGKLTRFRDETTSGGLGAVRPLRADGTKLPDDEMPNYLEFNRYPKRNFALLGLGT